jgi:hypothetical protein
LLSLGFGVCGRCSGRGGLSVGSPFVRLSLGLAVRESLGLTVRGCLGLAIRKRHLGRLSLLLVSSQARIMFFKLS